MIRIERNVAVILLFNDKGEVLLQLRDEKAERMPGYWAFFGGGIEEGETSLKAVKRETMEELGYELDEVSEVMVQDFEWENYYGKKHVFVAKYDRLQNLVLGEGKDMGWYRLPIVADMKMIGHDREVLEFVKNFDFK